MLRLTHLISAVVISLLTFSACSNNLKYFTTDLYRENNWSASELERVQFYLSEDIVLQRKLRGENTKITNGKIRVVDGSKIEEVIIEKGTPGILIESPARDKFAISFDSSDESKFLMFGVNPKANGKYVLLAKDWKRRYGTISYGNELYETSNVSAYAALMVDIKKARKVQVKSQRARGNRID